MRKMTEEEEGMLGLSFLKYFSTKGYWKKQKLLKCLKSKEVGQFLEAYNKWKAKNGEIQKLKERSKKKGLFERVPYEIRKELPEGDSLRDAVFEEHFNTMSFDGSSPLINKLIFRGSTRFQAAFDKWRKENKGKERYRLERYIADHNKAIDDWMTLVRTEKTTRAEKFFDSLIEGEQFNLRRLMAQSGLSGEDAYEFVRSVLSKRKIRIITATGPTEIYEKTRKEEWLVE